MVLKWTNGMAVNVAPSAGAETEDIGYNPPGYEGDIGLSDEEFFRRIREGQPIPAIRPEGPVYEAPYPTFATPPLKVPVVAPPVYAPPILGPVRPPAMVPQPVAAVPTPMPGPITNGIAPGMPIGEGLTAQPVVWGAAAGLIPKIGGLVVSKGLLGQLVRAALAGGVASGIWQIIANLFGLSPEQAILEANKKRRKRYTIGSNPRVRTLARVATHTKRLLKRHEKVIRAFIKPAARAGVKVLTEKYLSPVERAQIQK